MRRSPAGFSLLEVAFVCGATMIITSIAVIQLGVSRKVIDAQSAANMVVGQVNYARQVAIDQRRNVLVEFLGTNEIKITRLESDASTTVLSDLSLTAGFGYGLPSGEPPDTPEAFGNSSPVSFNGATGGTFLGDGTFVDSTGVVRNGTIFTIGAGDSTARAVTVTGATGRVLQYYMTEGAWHLVGQ